MSSVAVSTCWHPVGHFLKCLGREFRVMFQTISTFRLFTLYFYSQSRLCSKKILREPFRLPTIQWLLKPFTVLQEKSKLEEIKELHQRVLAGYDWRVRTMSGPCIVFNHHCLSSKCTSLCCVDPWSFFHLHVIFMAFGNICSKTKFIYCKWMGSIKK